MSESTTSEEIQNRLGSYLDHLESAALSTSDFVGEQAPLIVQEYLSWCLWSDCLGLSICLTLFVLFTIATVILVKAANAADTASGGDGLGLMGILSGIVAAILSLFCLDFLTHLIKVCVAPRLVVLEYVRSLLS